MHVGRSAEAMGLHTILSIIKSQGIHKGISDIMENHRSLMCLKANTGADDFMVILHIPGERAVLL